MQKLGQHFLKNKKVIAEIIGALAARGKDIIFEIGPGHGELTDALAENAGSGTAIVSIEKDERLCAAAQKKFAADGRIAVICGDALELLPSLISKYGGGNPDYLLAGNIPYYITGHLLRIISSLKRKPARCVFMVQKEVAERIAARAKSGTAAGKEKEAGMNRLAASVQFWAEPKIITAVPKKDFHPAPNVDSAVILLARKNGPAACGADRYYAAVRAIFSQPRKTVLNNISETADRAPQRIQSARRAGPQKKSLQKNGETAAKKKETMAAALKAIGIDPLCRPQNLSVEDIAAIAEKFF